MNVLNRLDAEQNWTAEERMLLDSVQQLTRERIAPRAAHYDKTGEFPWDNVAAINELGLNAIWRCTVVVCLLPRMRAGNQSSVRLNRHYLGH